jgi:hypothetical protein
MNRIVVRVCRVVLDLEDANRAIDDIAVLIELDVALESVQVRSSAALRRFQQC